MKCACPSQTQLALRPSLTWSFIFFYTSQPLNSNQFAGLCCFVYQLYRFLGKWQNLFYSIGISKFSFYLMLFRYFQYSQYLLTLCYFIYRRFPRQPLPVSDVACLWHGVPALGGSKYPKFFTKPYNIADDIYTSLAW